MKKKMILALTLSVFGIASYAFAQSTPSIPLPPATPPESVGTPSSFSLSKSVKGDPTPTQGNPLAPATLLLLGLAGSFAGVKIYQNNKKEE
ncbi:MAG: hypothetical protein ACI3Z9_07475 [Candidatus Onthomorpha sp.]